MTEKKENDTKWSERRNKERGRRKKERKGERYLTDMRKNIDKKNECGENKKKQEKAKKVGKDKDR